MRQHRIRDAALTVAAIIGGVALSGAGYAVARFAWDSPRVSLFGNPERKHLDEIPIDTASACGKVQTIHDALDAFQDSYLSAWLGIDPQQWEALTEPTVSSSAPLRPVTGEPWPVVAARLDASAQQLDVVLADGIPHFPPRVQHELTIVRESIAAGRLQMPEVTDPSSLRSVTRTAFDRGQLHAGYASDLVGDQCPVPLGA